MVKQEQHIIRGMQRDLAVARFNPEFAFECKNIRITARDNNTLLAVTNEKGNLYMQVLDKDGVLLPIEGVYVGHSVLNDYVVLFTTSTVTKEDYIYRLELKNDSFTGLLLYKGNLGFDTNYPIECISVYENEDIQKVYFLDGKNQTRYINIVAPDDVRAKWYNGSFDFVQKLQLDETITVVRDDIASGSFASGVIQYAFTYYNKYGQESNVFYTTPLQYISFSGRGASPEDKVSNCFNITITNPDTRFDYIRVYSIHRTSIDGTPTVKNVVDLSINSASSIVYTDNGTNGATVDPTELLYVGGEDVVFGTMTQKDNTLFLGNANIQRKLVGLDVINKIKGGNVSFSSKYVGYFGASKGYYPYKNSLYLGSKIKSFKYLEWYRFGIQFQHRTGKWSEPVWVNDAYNGPAQSGAAGGVRPSYDNGSLSVVQANYYMNGDVIKELVAQGFVRARGVVVYPTLQDREVIAQGILCPTVYNMADRFSNSPFAQASWFTRPNFAFDIERNASNWTGLTSSWTDYANSKAGVIRNSNVNLTVDPGTPTEKKVYIDIVNKGAWAEFRHGHPIPNNWERNAEIQALANVPADPYTDVTGSNLNAYVANHGEYYFVDQNILTLHSPDIEFDDGIQNMDASGLKMRIVGIAPMTANASDIDIQTSTPANDTKKMGFYKEFVGDENNSYHGLKNLISGAYWFDKMTDQISVDDDHGYTEAFFVYAWHRNGSLNNQGPTILNADTGITPVRSAMLDKKKISNLKFSSFTNYFSTPWRAYIEGDNNHTGITSVNIFSSNEQTLVRIPAPQYSGLPDINYYGNIDKVIAATRVDEEYQVTVELSSGTKTETFNRKEGYPIVVTGVNDAEAFAHKLFTGGTFPLQFVKRSDGKTMSNVTYGTDAVRMKYKSTPHAVFALNWTKDRKQVILPTTKETDYTSTWPVNHITGNAISNRHFFWNPQAKRITEDDIQVKDTTYQENIDYYTSSMLDNNYAYLYVAELYNDNVTNRFGGQTEEAFENNQWLPAGEPVSLVSGYDENDNPIPINAVNIQYTEGDTFLQRYDCMKTYPYTLEDQNSITDIVSFMCESRVNIDGRYDRNRGQISNLAMTTENFNKVNPVYNQTNNFFNYRGINHNKFNLNYFPNTITWTKEKQLGSIIDSWTNITMASTLDLDGDKGEVISLNTYNNEIFCFQRKGLSNILFNSRVQIPTSDGMPIEITNGLKVSGKRYMSNSIGCSNKWSVVESPSGLYFIDNETNSLYLFNGEISSLSDKLGFRQWVSDNNTHANWEPLGYINFRGFYDKNNNDVYFVNKDWCLCYSELIGQFTSFLSYEGVPAMFNISSEFYSFKDNRVYQQFAGPYNIFYGEYKPYSITIVANQDEPLDKVFNNVEFRADTYNGDTLQPEVTFDKLDVYNEYQHGSVVLSNRNGYPSSLKRKFRIWRTQIPRANTTINGIEGNNRDRIRNPWAYIKLSKNAVNSFRSVFYDMTVQYFV